VWERVKTAEIRIRELPRRPLRVESIVDGPANAEWVCKSNSRGKAVSCHTRDSPIFG
jgi:hypothetical protein